MGAAPLYDELAEGPEGGFALWLQASDGVRVRVGCWPTEGAKGTVLLFPGRTEYIEKYGQAAVDFAARGFATAAIDWRGQGLADRLHDDPMTGHVFDFMDYQADVQAMLACVREKGMPEPFYLVAHSMGGCIGLRALHSGLPVRAAAFSAPMWGILISPPLRPVAWALSWGSRHVGFHKRYTPGTDGTSYVRTAPFQGNTLTTDPLMFAYMQRQTGERPELALGGPSLNWLYEALAETRDLSKRDGPGLPILTHLGSDEKVVDPAPILQLMKRVPNGRLVIVPGAQHEIMMERPDVRQKFFDEATALFLKHP